jgi:biopolymer transport protein ExbB
MNPVTLVPAAADGLPSLWELTKSGGPIMWPIGVCSVVALAYAVERWLGLGSARLGSERFGRKVLETLRSSGVAPALELCRQERTPLARILETALRNSAATPGEREKRVEDVAADEVRKMSANLKPLLIVYIVAPLLGLLGTVWGLILAFATIATKQGLGKPELLANGVYQALVTTAGGLAVAIPTVILYYYLKGRVEGFARRTEALYIEVDQGLVPPEIAHAHP